MVNRTKKNKTASAQGRTNLSLPAGLLSQQREFAMVFRKIIIELFLIGGMKHRIQ